MDKAEFYNKLYNAIQSVCDSCPREGDDCEECAVRELGLEVMAWRLNNEQV